MPQIYHIGKHKTKITGRNFPKQDSILTVTYHNTEVVRVSNKEITLNTGGYMTVTTKLRMNQTANQYNLGYKVFQLHFYWYVKTPAGTFPFKGYILILNRKTLTLS